jgi:ankyrin repeat protein
MGHLDAVKMLASQGADVKVRKEDGPTPVLVTVGEGHLEAVKALASLDTDVNVADRDGMTSIGIAA